MLLPVFFAFRQSIDRSRSSKSRCRIGNGEQQNQRRATEIRSDPAQGKKAGIVPKRSSHKQLNIKEINKKQSGNHYAGSNLFR